MNDKKKAKFLTKSATFGGKAIALWSLDGVTWSTRKEELQTIHDRHEAERLKTIQHIGEVLSDERTKAQKAEAEDDVVEESDEPEIAPKVAEDVDDEELEVDEDDEESASKKKKSPKAAKPAKKTKPEKKKAGRAKVRS